MKHRPCVVIVALAVLTMASCSSEDKTERSTSSPEGGSAPVVVDGFEVPVSSGSFLGRVTEVEFGDTWSLKPSNIVKSRGPGSGTTLGPATLTFEDGSVLFMPEDTPGGNDCVQLISEAEWPGITGFDKPTPEQKRRNGPSHQDCWLYGGLDDSGDVLWFGIADYRPGNSLIWLPEITALHDGYATVAGVLELPVIPDDRSFVIRSSGVDVEVVAGKHAGCGGGTSFAEWWPSDQQHVTGVDIATLEIAVVHCIATQ